MTHGGARNGAGRKAGGRNGKMPRKQAACLATDGGVSPLQVMLDNMRYYWGRRNKSRGARDKAMACAVEAASFCHPKYASVAVDVSVTDPASLSDEECAAAPPP